MEIFAKGNVILLDGERKIIMPLKSSRMKDRDVLRGEIYEYPQSQLNPLTLTEEELARLFTASDKDLVRTLATQTNIGGMYAEEVCLIAGIDKNRVAKSLVGSEVHLLLNGIRTAVQTAGQKETCARTSCAPMARTSTCFPSS